MVISLIIIFLIGCGGAEIKVQNNTSGSLKEISISDVSFSSILTSGQGTEYKEIEEGTYNLNGYAYDAILLMWLGFTTVESKEIEEGGFLAGDEQYTWTILDSTQVVFQ